MPRLKWVEDCINRGLRVYAQGFTSRSGLEMTFKEWNLFDDSPTWRAVTIGTPEERKQKMQNQEHRQRMREEWDGGAIRPGSNMVGSLDGLLVAEVASPEFEEFEGMTGKQIAEKTGKHIVDAILDLVVADGLDTEFSIQLADPSGRLECTTAIANSPYAIGGVSDGGAHVKFYVAGSFPTDMLVWLVRDEGTVSLEDAHYKLSYFPAFCAGIKDRGYLREGLAADIVVYNLEDLSLKPTEVLHDLPGDEWRRVQRADGYRWTLVNGQITFENGKPTGELPGTLLRNGGG
jgi:N-acyl-D-aspartate/D-glutamate deacylase